MPRIPTEPDETPTYLYNPLKEDFTHQFDRKDYTIPSRQIREFPKWLADHLAKHLISKLALEDPDRIHFEERVKRWHDKVYIDL